LIDYKKIWIEEGYFSFAYQGPKETKIERLAKAIGRNKSSFYHFCATIELFHEDLLDVHLNKIMSMAEKFKKANSLDDLISILIEHKTDLLFNRQLRVYRQKKHFQQCFQKTNEIVGLSMLNVWKNVLKLENNSYLARLVLKLSVENFFIQITEDHLNEEWLRNYFVQLNEMVTAFKNKTLSDLNGSV